MFLKSYLCCVFEVTVGRSQIIRFQFHPTTITNRDLWIGSDVIGIGAYALIIHPSPELIIFLDLETGTHVDISFHLMYNCFLLS